MAVLSGRITPPLRDLAVEGGGSDLRPLLEAEIDQDRRRDEHRRVGADHEAEQHGVGKALEHLAAEDREGDER
jgi:hypothetical protein